ncbi:MAG: hypothetical protein K6F49_09855 [Saccharofermentans sp.]|nr:hypothetical protein [Saccharofermentans sp.]
MSSAREDLQALLEGKEVPKVDFPMTFDDISLISASSSDNTTVDAFIGNTIPKMHEIEQVVPQYRSLPEKIGGLLFGFYINHAVYKQNDVNKNLGIVFDEVEANRKEIAELRAGILKLNRKLSSDREKK